MWDFALQQVVSEPGFHVESLLGQILEACAAFFIMRIYIVPNVGVNTTIPDVDHSGTVARSLEGGRWCSR